MKLEDKLFLDRYLVDDSFAHITVKDPLLCLKCESKQCTTVCPSGVYTLEGDHIDIAYEDCLECGTCRVACNEFNNIEWEYPRGGFGVMFKFG